MRDIVSSSGSVLDHVVYDSFGNILTESNASNGDRFKFAVMQYDSVASLSYDRARSFVPNVGRFVEQDARGFSAGDTNLYAYTHGDPVNATDPTGAEEQEQGDQDQDESADALWMRYLSEAQLKARQQKLQQALQQIAKSLTDTNNMIDQLNNLIEIAEGTEDEQLIAMMKEVKDQALAVGQAQVKTIQTIRQQLAATKRLLEPPPAGPMPGPPGMQNPGGFF